MPRGANFTGTRRSRDVLIAQLVERTTDNREVGGSSPPGNTRFQELAAVRRDRSEGLTPEKGRLERRKVKIVSRVEPIRFRHRRFGHLLIMFVIGVACRGCMQVSEFPIFGNGPPVVGSHTPSTVGSRAFEMVFWDVAKLVRQLVLVQSFRRFESCRPSHSTTLPESSVAALLSRGVEQSGSSPGS